MNDVLSNRHGSGSPANNVNILNTLNDIFAVLYICGFFYYSQYQIIFWPIQFTFFGLTFINAYINQRKINLLCIWAISFFIYCALTLLWADNKSVSLLITLTKIALSLCFISLYVHNKEKANTLINSVVLGAVILAVRLIIYTPAEEWGTTRLGASIGMNENLTGILLLYGSIMCLFLTKKNNLYFILFLIISVLALLSGSKKVFFTIFVVIFVYFIEKINKPVHLLYLIPLAVSMYAIYYMIYNNEFMYNILGKRVDTFFQTITDSNHANKRSSTYIRMDLIKVGIEAFLKKPIEGYGIGNFKYMNEYQYYAHNNYVELLVSTGLIGTILYYVMPAYLLIKSMAIYIAKNKSISLYMLIMILIFITDIGAVTYYNDVALILLALSFSMITQHQWTDPKIVNKSGDPHE